MKKLSDVCDLITDGTHQTPIYCGSGGYPFLSSKDVVGEKINWNSLKYIPYSLHKDLYKRLQPQINDILLAKNGINAKIMVSANNACNKKLPRWFFKKSPIHEQA